MGSENANQKSAVATSVVWRGGVELSALVDEPDHRLRQDQHRGRRGQQDEDDLAHPVGHRRPQVVELAARAKRARVGKRTVAIATEKIPCGSW